ncbi:MAG: D-alanyl-D-alanine carboxypeptidase family protein [Oscillospiraceae bacterium]
MQKKMLIKIQGFLILALCFLTIFSKIATALDYDDESVLDVSAKSAIVMEKETGRILYGKNINDKRAVASTTKIMTALLTLEQENLDEFFRVDDNAINVAGTSAGLRHGDKACLRDLAVGMLLPSGNDAANAAAVKISGSIPEFAKLMNKRAEEIGMKNTKFVTPSGLDDGEPYSTAYDMALLTRTALDNKDFASICSKKSTSVSFGDPPTLRFLYNHNRLLKEYSGCNGVKTGFTKKSGRCLVSSVTAGNKTLICVTLSASDDWNIHKNLYNKYMGETHHNRKQGKDSLFGRLGGHNVPCEGGRKRKNPSCCNEKQI